jgi:FtsZ-interacting cell division protein ZipA
LPMVEVAAEPIARAPDGPPAHESAEGKQTGEAQETAEAQATAEAPESHADDTEEVPLIELESAADAATEPVDGEAAGARAPVAAESTAVASGLRPREVLPELPPAAPLLVEWPSGEERRILALRLVAPQAERFPGRSLRQALAAEGFLLGQFAIFHKPDDERRAVLSAASLTRPGTFDMETMDSQHYGGLSLFAVLPGPKSPPQAFEELVFAARNLNERLHGVLQDEQGVPLTPARIAQLREQLRTGTES